MEIAFMASTAAVWGTIFSVAITLSLLSPFRALAAVAVSEMIYFAAFFSALLYAANELSFVTFGAIGATVMVLTLARIGSAGHLRRSVYALALGTFSSISLAPTALGLYVDHHVVDVGSLLGLGALAIVLGLFGAPPKYKESSRTNHTRRHE